MFKKFYNTRNQQKKIKNDESSSSDEEEEWESEDESSSSTSDSSSDEEEDIKETNTDDDYEEEDEDEDKEISNFEYKKFLSQLFPSKYMDKKVEKEERKEEKKDLKNIKKGKKEKAEEKKEKKEKKKDKKEKKGSKKMVQEEDDDVEEEEEQLEEIARKDDKINIIFTIGEEERDAYEAFEETGEEDDDDDDECDTEDEETFMKEAFERIDVPIESVEENNSIGQITSPKSNKKSKKKLTKKEKEELKRKERRQKKKEDRIKEKELKLEEDKIPDIEPEYKNTIELKRDLIEKLKQNPKSDILKNAIKDCDESIQIMVKTARKKNVRLYRKLIHGGSNFISEFEYFKTKLSNKEQLAIMKELKVINECINIDKPYRLSLLQSNIPPKYKATVLQKLNILKSMEPGDPEYYKIKNWIDTFIRIPFNVYKNLSVSMSDGIDICHTFMQNAKAELDNCVYGLNDAKLQILQMVGQWISNPDALGTAIAIKGPPGTGKTSLVKEGISKILGREFAFIALGGAGDSSFLDGHSYTYEGSSWGKIVQILIDSKCMNPVIYFDELDKISDTPKGEEIIGILTHLTDTTQNSQFHDKYFSDIDFDISKCLFIFSYNDESKVNPILKDRMYRIQTKGYEIKEKTIIAQKYLLPKIREQVNFKEGEVIITDEIIQYLVSTEAFTKKEDGVRNLKRCLEIIHTKLNLFRLIKTDDNIFIDEIGQHIEFPITVTKKHVDVFIKNEEKQNQSLLAMYI